MNYILSQSEVKDKIKKFHKKIMNSESISKIAETYNVLSYRVFSDRLLLEDNILKDFPGLLELKKEMLHIIESSNSIILNETMLSNDIDFFKKSLGLKKTYEKVKFSEVVKEDHISLIEAEEILEELEEISKLIPDKYKKNLDITLVLKHGNKANRASFDEYNLILLDIDVPRKILYTRFLHELMHILEKNNEILRDKALSFLESRIYGKNKKSLKDIKKVFSGENTALDIPVYTGQFIDPYMGRTYGEDDGDLDKKPFTEVLSVGMENLFFNPFVLETRDPELYKILVEILQD
tara:strand:- start:1410 stop:2291 length:882 start_codon:yes stop_codon:yes gene_type:complete